MATWIKNNFESKDGDLINSWTIIGTKEELDAGITKTRDGRLLAENSRFFDKKNFDLYFFNGDKEDPEWELGGEED